MNQSTDLRFNNWGKDYYVATFVVTKTTFYWSKHYFFVLGGLNELESCPCLVEKWYWFPSLMFGFLGNLLVPKKFGKSHSPLCKTTTLAILTEHCPHTCTLLTVDRCHSDSAHAQPTLATLVPAYQYQAHQHQGQGQGNPVTCTHYWRCSAQLSSDWQWVSVLFCLPLTPGAARMAWCNLIICLQWRKNLCTNDFRAALGPLLTILNNGLPIFGFSLLCLRKFS